MSGHPVIAFSESKNKPKILTTLPNAFLMIRQRQSRNGLFAPRISRVNAHQRGQAKFQFRLTTCARTVVSVVSDAGKRTARPAI
jgi:hypothetical protein